jgi:AraC-like DNA-binding protein
MYKMHMYRDGTLPVLQQQFHTARLEILRCSYWVIRLWNHANLASPYWRLYWNHSTGGEVQWQEQRFLLDSDQLLLIAPHTPFTTRFHPDGVRGYPENVMQGCPAAEWDDAEHAGERVLRHLFIHFIVGAPYDALAPQIIAIPIDSVLRALLEEIIVPVAADPHSFTRRQSFQLRALLSFALAAVPEARWPAPQTDERIVTVMRFIDEHYQRPLCNDDFAALATMSAKAFVRLFKERTQQTPLAYVLQRRLENASILLHHTDESVERIAERCGFCDRHHFSKLFQRAFGVGPATYRKTRMR